MARRRKGRGFNFKSLQTGEGGKHKLIYELRRMFIHYPLEKSICTHRHSRSFKVILIGVSRNPPEVERIVVITYNNVDIISETYEDIASGKLQIRRFQPPDFGCPALFQCNVGVYAVMIISRNTSCRPTCKSLKKFKTSRRSLQRSAVWLQCRDLSKSLPVPQWCGGVSSVIVQSSNLCRPRESGKNEQTNAERGAGTEHSAG